MTHSMYCDKTHKRSSECDDLDHMPSAKRIKTKSSLDSGSISISHQNTQLHSNNQIFFDSQKCNTVQSSAQEPLIGYQNNNHVAQNNVAYVSQEECTVFQSDFKYLPDLNAIENPYYYDNNKLLFELYVERVQRATVSQQVTSSQQHQSF